MTSAKPVRSPSTRLVTTNLIVEGVDAHIDFKSSSGDIELAGVDLVGDSDIRTSSGDYSIKDMTVREGTRFKTSSGDVELNNVRIEESVKLSSSSGDIVCTDCTGHMEFSSSSGDVVVKDSRIDGASKFSSASGGVSLYLEELPDEDLSASSASGRVLLDVEDFGDNYVLVLTSRKDRGRIVCPFQATDTRTFSRHRQIYEEIRVEHGSGGPDIALRTASGRVIVRN